MKLISSHKGYHLSVRLCSFKQLKHFYNSEVKCLGYYITSWQVGDLQIAQIFKIYI